MSFVSVDFLQEYLMVGGRKGEGEYTRESYEGSKMALGQFNTLSGGMRTIS
jgi:hypothetical protein